MVAGVGFELHPAVLFIITLYVPAASPDRLFPDWNVAPLSKLYVTCNLNGNDDCTCSQGTCWLGQSNGGAAGAPGTGLTVNEVGKDTHAAFEVVTS